MRKEFRRATRPSRFDSNMSATLFVEGLIVKTNGLVQIPKVSTLLLEFPYDAPFDGIKAGDIHLASMEWGNLKNRH